jgi:hypothetical protein
LGIISVVSLLIQKEKLARYAHALENMLEQGIDTLFLPPLVSRDVDLRSTSIIVLIKLLFFSACNLGVYLVTKYIQIDSFWLFLLLFGLLIVYLYVWAWSFLIILIFHLLEKKEPVLLEKTFEICDYGLSVVAVGIFLVFFLPIRDFSSWLSSVTVVGYIAKLTLPLILVGTLFQIIAALLA